MENADVVKMLEDISNYLLREDYQQLFAYVEKRKKEINAKTDPSSEYIDDLVQNLK